MKDEVEKLIKQIIAYAFDKGYNDGILAQPDHEKAEQFKSDLLALIDKAQVEAVRAELETALSECRTRIHDGYHNPEFDCLDAEYLTDRLTKEDGETK